MNNRIICNSVLSLLWCFSLGVMNTSAQFYVVNSFSPYSYFISKVMDISWEIPKNFVWKSTERFVWSQGSWGQKGLGFTYTGAMQSEDGNCLILYSDYSNVMLGSLADLSKSNDGISFARREMLYDMSDVFEKDISLASIPSNFVEYVDTYIGRDAPFNADTVFVAQLPLKIPYQRKYSYCTGIYACKQNRPTMIFKCFFTNEGKMNEKKYLSEFYKSVRYRRNNNWTYDHEKALFIFYKLSMKEKLQ